MSVVCEGTRIEGGTIIEELTLSCSNANQRLGMRVHTWPFDDENTGRTTIQVKGKAKNWKKNKCQKALKKMFKNTNVIKCDPVVETSSCTCNGAEIDQ